MIIFFVVRVALIRAVVPVCLICAVVWIVLICVMVQLFFVVGVARYLELLEEESDGLYIQDIIRGGITNDDSRIPRNISE